MDVFVIFPVYKIVGSFKAFVKTFAFSYISLLTLEVIQGDSDGLIVTTLFGMDFLLHILKNR